MTVLLPPTRPVPLANPRKEWQAKHVPWQHIRTVLWPTGGLKFWRAEEVTEWLHVLTGIRYPEKVVHEKLLRLARAGHIHGCTCGGCSGLFHLAIACHQRENCR